MKKVTLNVQGMSCNHCVSAVEGAMKQVGATGKVDLAKGTVDVEYDDSKISLDQIKAAIEDQGYDVA